MGLRKIWYKTMVESIWRSLSPEITASVAESAASVSCANQGENKWPSSASTNEESAWAVLFCISSQLPDNDVSQSQIWVFCNKIPQPFITCRFAYSIWNFKFFYKAMLLYPKDTGKATTCGCKFKAPSLETKITQNEGHFEKHGF